MKSIYNCELLSQQEVAPGVVRARLRGAEIARDALPGQFVNVRVSAGTTDPLLRRPFSVHAVFPEEGIYSLLYVLVGRGTALLRQARPGDMINVVGPLGTPFDVGDSPDAEHVVVAGGCGAAPLHFLCDAVCAKWGCEKVTVLAGAQTRDAVLCEPEFRAHNVEVSISTDDGSYGYRGFVTDLLKDHLARRGSGANVRVYSCGPHAMLSRVARIAAEAGVQRCQVSLENSMSCGVGVCMGCVQKIRGAAEHDESGRDWHYERVCADGPVFDAEDVIW